MTAILLITTSPNHQISEKIASTLLNHRLAACINIIPGIQSKYWWHGKIESADEEILIIKSKESLLEKVSDALRATHPYEVPELISFKPEYVEPGYLQWLEQETLAE